MQGWKRLVKVINYNRLSYAISGVALLYILTSPTVSDPILNFCFAGVIPGTNHVIAPDAMIIGVAITLCLIAATLVLVATSRRINTRRMLDASTKQSHAPQSSAALPGVPVSGKHIREPRVTMFAVMLGHAARRVAVSLSRAGAHLPAWFWPEWFAVFLSRFGTTVLGILRVVVMPACYAVSVSVWWLIRFVARTVANFVLRSVLAYIVITDMGARAVYRGITKLWRWLRPKMIQADTWLEVQYRAAEAWLKESLLKFEPVDIVVMMAHDGRKSMLQFYRRWFK